MTAVSSLALTKVVARSCPLKRTTEPGVKLDPLTVSARPALPALLVGEIEVTTGTGLSEGCGPWPS
jgi:hypothetical protein